MIGRTNVGGGGGAGGNAFAVIAVTYPEGSVCTCTNGAKTLKAKDTSGSYLFVLPEAGTWTVSCTDGTQTTSQTVVIDTQYQVENVDLLYELVLYDSGNLYGYPWTVCMQKSENPYSTPTGDTLYVNQKMGGSVAGAIGFFINEKIDLTEYSSIKFHGTESLNSQKLGVFLTDGVRTQVSTGGDTQVYYYMVNHQGDILASIFSDGTLPDDGVMSLDVSSVEGEHYITIGTRAVGTSSNLSLTVDKVWIE